MVEWSKIPPATNWRNNIACLTTTYRHRVDCRYRILFHQS
nr:MAG TPA: hypothetical protein [Caudoviricetes sp.]